jgi:protein-disulfide isomerase
LSVSEQEKPKIGTSSNIWQVVIAVVIALAGAVAIYWYRGGFEPSERAMVKGDPNPATLRKEGPLPDIWIGKADAPNTVVEYASMTCPHCAQFQNDVFPAFKAKYIDSGQVKYVLREFPLDGLAAAAFMLARCAGPDRYYPIVDGLFETQETWAVPSSEGKDKLLQVARQAGFSKESFDKCLADKDLFKKVVDTRNRAHDKFGIDSTPTFFINAKRLKGDHQLKDFDAAFAVQGVVVPEPAPSAAKPQPAPSAEVPAEAPSSSDVSPPANAEAPQPSPSQSGEPSTWQGNAEMPAPSRESAPQGSAETPPPAETSPPAAGESASQSGEPSPSPGAEARSGTSDGNQP